MKALKRVRVVFPGPTQSEAALPVTLEVGKTGILELCELDNQQVLVVGERSTFKFWPANVVWGEPLAAQNAQSVDGVSAPSAVRDEESAVPSPTPVFESPEAAGSENESSENESRHADAALAAAGLASLAQTASEAGKENEENLSDGVKKEKAPRNNRRKGSKKCAKSL